MFVCARQGQQEKQGKEEEEKNNNKKQKRTIKTRKRCEWKRNDVGRSRLHMSRDVFSHGLNVFWAALPKLKAVGTLKLVKL